jgi:hypothetical protein
MYQLAITAVYMVIARGSALTTPAAIRKTAKVAVMALALIGTSVLGTYKFFNQFRFALQARAGSDVAAVDMGAAINEAMSSKFAASNSSLMEIYNRITGLETLAAVVNLSDKLGNEGSLAAMIDGTVVENFAYYIHGTSESKTRFSVTQFGYYYLSGGMVGLVLGCLLLGYIFCLIQYYVLRINVHHAMKLAFLPALWILYIKSLLGGGDMTLWLKEVAVLVLTFYTAARLASPVKSTKCSAVVSELPIPAINLAENR